MEFRQLLPEPATVDVDVLLASLAPGEHAALGPSVHGGQLRHQRRWPGHVRRPLGAPRRRRGPRHVPRPAGAVRRGHVRNRNAAHGALRPHPRQARAARAREPSGVCRPSRWPASSPAAARCPRTSRCSPSRRRASSCSRRPRSSTGRWAAQVEVVCLDPGELTLTTVLRHLRSEHGIRSLLCEGGPTLFGGAAAGGAWSTSCF